MSDRYRNAEGLYPGFPRDPVGVRRGIPFPFFRFLLAARGERQTDPIGQPALRGCGRRSIRDQFRGAYADAQHCG